jgi:tellurium resistance protein TerD
MQITKGQNISITRQSPTTRSVKVTFGLSPAEANLVPDASAFLLTGAGKVRGDGDFVFYNNPRTPESMAENESFIFITLLVYG